MTYLWPHHLWLLLALPLLPPLYLWLLRRRRKAALRFSSLAVARPAMQGRHWRRHLPPALLGLACAALLLAAARPVTRVPLPWVRSTVLLAIDVSLSMRVDDVKPTRLAAAQEAAKLFLRELPGDVQVGLVTFAGSAEVAQRATRDRAALAVAIDALQMQMHTAVGSAIVRCLAELFPEQGIDVGEMTFGGPAREAFRPVAPGSHTTAAIVLLSDGRRTTGIDTLEAARMAAERGVRIHVVGLGTPGGTAHLPEGMAIYLQLDEPTLREVARITGGEYHHAGTAEMLRSVYGTLGSQLAVQTRETEITALLALLAAVLAASGAALSLLWFGRAH